MMALPASPSGGARRPSRSRAAKVGAILLPMWALAACAGPSANLPVPSYDDAAEDVFDARERSTLSSRELAPATTVVDGLEVRVSDLDVADATVRGRVVRPRTELRVPLQNPWKVRADRRTHRALVDGELARIDLARNQFSAQTCLLGIDATAHAEQVASWEQLAIDLAQIQAWLDDLLRERLIGAPEHRVRALSLRTALERARPRPGASTDTDAIPLPALSTAPGTPMLDRATLARALEAHPTWALARAEHARWAGLASREDAKRLPWLRFIAVGYTPRLAAERPVAEGRIAMEIPLGIDEARKAKTYEMRAVSARLEGQSQMMDHLRALRAALSTWDSWERTIPALIAARDASAEHRALALEWVRERAVRPAEAESLLLDAYALDRAVRDARADAGATACQVRALGGVHPAQWPRSPVAATDE